MALGGRLLGYVVLSAVALSMLLPFLWMLSTSLKEPGNIFLLPPQWIPDPVHWLNYADLFDELPFHLFFINSLKIAILVVFGSLISNSMAAFAFARVRFPGRGPLFAVLLSTLMVPGTVTMVPVFIIMRSLGWLDSHLPLIVPAFAGSAFGTFFLRQFFLSLPSDYVDSARIDGCRFFGVYWRIFLPLAKPALATLAIFTFMGSWNGLIGPLIYINSVDKMTLTLGLALLRGGQQNPGRYTLVMAGAMISVIPMILLFFSAQKYFVQGVIRSGLRA
ncbi:MAG: carbohydrate ABC transporter permease [Anaerolineae bacterium]